MQTTQILDHIHLVPETATPRQQEREPFSIRNWFFTSDGTFKWEILLVLGLLILTGVAQGYNMFHFPYIHNDEGTYISQAWAILKEGQLAPYTYWYDHAPAGWIQIALWFLLTGGIRTFGWIIYSGRVLMLVYQLISSLLVYAITKKVSQTKTGAVIAVILFSFSAFSLYYHRRVLIDNICVPWMLGSILLLLSDKVTLNKIWLSGVLLGISILSKEDVVFLIPVMTYFVWSRMDRSNRWFAAIGWISIVCGICSIYFLYAIVKSELFPTGTLLGGTNAHVSLLGTLQYQDSRGKDAGLLSLQSGFWQLAFHWIHDEPLLVAGGTVSAFLCILLWKKKRELSILGLCLISLWVFLGRGGITLGFYILPLVPLLAILVGSFIGYSLFLLLEYIHYLDKKGQNVRSLSTWIPIGIPCVFILLTIGALLPGYTTTSHGFSSDPYQLWNSNPADAQMQSVQWVEAHISTSATIVTDDAIWTDLRDTGTGKNYTHIQWYWKIGPDPAINKVLHNDWRSIDYVVVSPQLNYDVANTPSLSLTAAALQHSTEVAHFSQGGMLVTIMKVNKGS